MKNWDKLNKPVCYFLLSKASLMKKHWFLVLECVHLNNQQPIVLRKNPGCLRLAIEQDFRSSMPTWPYLMNNFNPKQFIFKTDDEV